MRDNRRRCAPVCRMALVLMLALMSAACGAAAIPVVPTTIPTETATFTPSPTETPDRDSTPTLTPTQPPLTPTGGPSPTPLFGPTRPAVDASAGTLSANPGGPRVEFFTSDVLAVAPGATVTLFWSVRNVSEATIYRVEPDGTRSQLWEVPSNGRLNVPTRTEDRDVAEFIISAGEGAQQVEQSLLLPLSCPEAWFFDPAPTACPLAPPTETRLIEQEFERGRLLYVEDEDVIYALLNDGQDPAWVALDNRFDPAVHPESEEGFVPPPGFVQPLRILGFVWRGNDLVRNRLGMGLAPELSYDGFVQAARVTGGQDVLYFSSANGSALRLMPSGEAWQIITPP